MSCVNSPSDEGPAEVGEGEAHLPERMGGVDDDVRASRFGQLRQGADRVMQSGLVVRVGQQQEARARVRVEGRGLGGHDVRGHYPARWLSHLTQAQEVVARRFKEWKGTEWNGTQGPAGS